MSEPKLKPLAVLVEEVTSCTVALEEARREASIARNREADCLGRLNAAQRELDAAIAAMKKAAPRDSDWRADERRSVSVPA